MMVKLTEALIASVNTAVEEQTMHFGPHYASALEGYGDIAREPLALQDNVKAVKKGAAEVVSYVGAQDLSELHKALILMEGKANMVAYEALRMCACIKRFEETVKNQSGGDLFDLMDDDEQEE